MAETVRNITVKDILDKWHSVKGATLSSIISSYEPALSNEELDSLLTSAYENDANICGVKGRQSKRETLADIQKAISEISELSDIKNVIHSIPIDKKGQEARRVLFQNLAAMFGCSEGQVESILTFEKPTASRYKAKAGESIETKQTRLARVLNSTSLHSEMLLDYKKYIANYEKQTKPFADVNTFIGKNVDTAKGTEDGMSGFITKDSYKNWIKMVDSFEVIASIDASLSTAILGTYKSVNNRIKEYHDKSTSSTTIDSVYEKFAYGILGKTTESSYYSKDIKAMADKYTELYSGLSEASKGTVTSSLLEIKHLKEQIEKDPNCDKNVKEYLLSVVETMEINVTNSFGVSKDLTHDINECRNKLNIANDYLNGLEKEIEIFKSTAKRTGLIKDEDIRTIESYFLDNNKLFFAAAYVDDNFKSEEKSEVKVLNGKVTLTLRDLNNHIADYNEVSSKILSDAEYDKLTDEKAKEEQDKLRQQRTELQDYLVNNFTIYDGNNPSESCILTKVSQPYMRTKEIIDGRTLSKDTASVSTTYYDIKEKAKLSGDKVTEETATKIIGDKKKAAKISAKSESAINSLGKGKNGFFHRLGRWFGRTFSTILIPAGVGAAALVFTFAMGGVGLAMGNFLFVGAAVALGSIALNLTMRYAIRKGPYFNWCQRGIAWSKQRKFDRTIRAALYEKQRALEDQKYLEARALEGKDADDVIGQDIQRSIKYHEKKASAYEKKATKQSVQIQKHKEAVNPGSTFKTPLSELSDQRKTLVHEVSDITIPELGDHEALQDADTKVKHIQSVMEKEEDEHTK